MPNNTMTSEQLRKAIDDDKPRPYDITNPDEIKRLYRECGGYLRTCHHKHGTDWEGRKFAIDALDALIKDGGRWAHRDEEGGV